MRLWHQDLISKLPRQQLLGQHRECCALRGMGWGKKHSTVNYVFTHSIEKLIGYHMLIIYEMENRGYYGYNNEWKNPQHRGKQLNKDSTISPYQPIGWFNYGKEKTIYPEHNQEYLQECLDNLKGKGIFIK